MPFTDIYAQIFNDCLNSYDCFFTVYEHESLNRTQNSHHGLFIHRGMALLILPTYILFLRRTFDFLESIERVLIMSFSMLELDLFTLSSSDSRSTFTESVSKKV